MLLWFIVVFMKEKLVESMVAIDILSLLLNNIHKRTFYILRRSPEVLVYNIHSQPVSHNRLHQGPKCATSSVTVIVSNIVLLLSKIIKRWYLICLIPIC